MSLPSGVSALLLSPQKMGREWACWRRHPIPHGSLVRVLTGARIFQDCHQWRTMVGLGERSGQTCSVPYGESGGGGFSTPWTALPASLVVALCLSGHCPRGYPQTGLSPLLSGLERKLLFVPWALSFPNWGWGDLSSAGHSYTLCSVLDVACTQAQGTLPPQPHRHAHGSRTGLGPGESQASLDLSTPMGELPTLSFGWGDMVHPALTGGSHPPVLPSYVVCTSSLLQPSAVIFPCPLADSLSQGTCFPYC